MNRFQLARSGAARQAENRYSFDQYIYDAANLYGGGTGGLIQSWTPDKSGRQTERSDSPFEHWVANAYKSNGIVFACQVARLSVFSQARFQFQQLRGGRPGDLFGTPELGILEVPWVNGATGDLLARMIQDADFAGNAYVRRADPTAEYPGVERLRPDWVDIVLGSSPGRLTRDVLGYMYYPEGPSKPDSAIALTREEVAHWAPYPDPIASYRGMSWLTPVLREVQADRAATEHKQKFFDHAAPQPLDAKVLTPTGWSVMGAMEVGSRVIGLDGKPHDVIGVYPQGEQDIYRVSFSDGSATECTGDHVWSVASYYDRKCGTRRTMTLRQIVDGGITYKSGTAKWSVPLAEPVVYDEGSPLPIPAYLLGALLGDGSFRGNGKGSGGISLAAAAEDADEMESTFGPMLPQNVTISRRDRGGWSEFYFKGPGGSRLNPLTDAVRNLGLYGKLGVDKFIPEPYMRASITDRVSLLQGLIDTDGHIDARLGMNVRFTNTSEGLCRQLAELAGSLGGTASVSAVPTKRQWSVLVKRLPHGVVPCRLSRKVQRYSPASYRGRYRYISAVEFVGHKQAQCISVDVADSLYVTDDYIVTHNTPNLVIKFDSQLAPEKLERFKELMEAEHVGFRNAYKNLYLGGGADATVVGADFKQMDFKAVQGAGETRIASAARVPPIIAGLSQGLEAATYSNYAQARRHFADGCQHPLWSSVSAALQSIVRVPTGSRLWYDHHHIAFLREDEKDAAEIESVKSTTIANLVREGFEPNSVVQAVMAQDMSLLVHSGRVSVQLLEPGEQKSSALSTNGHVPQGVSA